MDLEAATRSNPDNKYDTGEYSRFFMWANQDDLVVNLIGRGVGVGFHTVIPGSVQPSNRHMIGKRDYLFMLDGGGHAWMHEIDEYEHERSENHFHRFIGTRRVAKVQPQHEVTMEL